MSHDHNHDHEERELITLVDDQGNETLFEILCGIWKWEGLEINGIIKFKRNKTSLIWEVFTLIEIREVVENKKQFLSLLLLADEQEDMIDRYIADGTMYVLDDNGVKGECVVLNVGNNTLEIKNIAIHPDYQRKGYGQLSLILL